jgi:regulator of PEP synthase PpsR (kinase-PPPase family)
MTANAHGYFHLHLISDSTGETLITVARAAAAQYSRLVERVRRAPASS